MYLLFPGRHHLLTKFQISYLTNCVQGDAPLKDTRGSEFSPVSPIDCIVWAVTSANHANTRRNPVPGHRREAAIEILAKQLPVPSRVYLIDDIGTTPRFADYVIKTIDVASFGQVRLNPQNTLVGCSTPEVIEMYEQLGFRILPVELQDRDPPTFLPDTPWQLFNEIVRLGVAGQDWQTDQSLIDKIAPPTLDLYHRYGFDRRIVELHRSDVLTDDGDLTETRDYNTYVRSFDSGARRKYELAKDFVQPGRIVDIGCCTGALISELTRDDRLHESDFYGIEISRKLHAECIHRKQQGAFANDHVFFYQKDFAAGPMFEADSVDTFLTFALTHEIESYGSRQSLLKFMELLHGQLAVGGRWINVDVVGPESDEVVYLWLNRDDGQNEDFERDFAPTDRDGLKEYLGGMSTFTRFLRFARDFRRMYGETLEYRLPIVDDRTYVELPMRDACEYISKKDYVDNWNSEMHERFCFWGYSQWSQAVADRGFRILPGSQAFTNPWIVENRYRGQVEFFRPRAGGLEKLEYPVTNMILVADKTN